MLSFSLGPFALAINHLLLLLALALATLVGWISGRKRRINPERSLFGLFVVGVFIARLSFVVAYWTQYQGDLLGIVDIRDGGFLLWPGVVAVVAGALLRGWKHPTQRSPLGLGVASGVLFLLLSNLVLNLQNQDARLPDVTLRNGAGDPVHLSDYQGKKLVINLWATWCPPCRREMPVLQAAQAANPDIIFLFVNQGESPREVASFFASQGLHLTNVLFDSGGELARHVGSAALPTSLFYNPDGSLLSNHLGELSSASLKRSLDRFNEPATSSSPSRSAQ